MRRLFLSFVAVLALASCGKPDDPVDPEGNLGYPALWEIGAPNGAVEGWMVGTIHSLPEGVRWRSAEMERTINEADLLVVEVAGLDDAEAMAEVFASLAFDTPARPLADRVSLALRDTYRDLIEDVPGPPDQFDRMETWAAALALAQSLKQGDSDNGVDRALLEDFTGREIVELEGTEKQLAIFDGLPEEEQKDLLDAVIEEAVRFEGDELRLARVWKSGDIDELERLTRQGMLSDPELREALLLSRNRTWAAQLENLLSAQERPLIAVGAGHVVGEDGLPRMLEQRGYRLRRIH